MVTDIPIIVSVTKNSIIIYNAIIHSNKNYLCEIGLHGKIVSQDNGFSRKSLRKSPYLI